MLGALGAGLVVPPCTIAECLRYVWSLPVTTAVVGMERPELGALRERIRPQARLELEWYKRG